MNDPRCTCASPSGACIFHGRGRFHWIRSLGCGYYEVMTRADTHPSGKSTPAAPRDVPEWGSLWHRCVEQLLALEPA